MILVQYDYQQLKKQQNNKILKNLQLIISILMPPKKQATKKEAVARPDNSGIAKNDIQFKWTISITSSSPTINYVLLFQWFGVTSDKIQQNDTPLVDAWPKEEGNYVFRKQFGLIRVDDDFCKSLSNETFYIYIVDAEDNKVKQQIHLDLSGLLMAQGEKIHNITYQNDKLKIIQIERIVISIQANKELITPLYRHYLNPFQIEIHNAKNLPDESAKNYLPAYVKYTFFDGKIIKTHSLFGKNKISWDQKHVFLLGLMDSEWLLEKLRSVYLRFQLHDRDEIKNTEVKVNTQITDIKKMIEIENQKQKPAIEDPKKKKQEKKEVKKEAKKQKKKDAKLGDLVFPPKLQTITSNFGVAAFYLIDFLKPNNLNLKLTSGIVPRKLFQDYESKNIDLNTTARTQMQKVISSNTYFDNDTTLSVVFTLSYSIGSFSKSMIPVEILSPVKEQKKGGKPPAAKKQEPKKQEKKEQVKKQQATEIIKEQKQKKDIFTRIIYLFPYKSPELLKQIQDKFYQINLRAMNMTEESLKQLTNTILKPEQRNSKTLDYISGIEIIDPQFRLFVLEGLKQGGMKEFDELVKRKQPNSKTFKILKNKNISFVDRLYGDFNLEIKRIRLRPSLDGLLIDSSIYVKSKVPQEICQTLNNIANVKKIADNLAMVVSMNLWFSSKGLLQVENKFSSALSKQDVLGIPQSPKSKRKSKSPSPEPTMKQSSRQVNIKPEKTYIQRRQLSPVQLQKQLRQKKKHQIDLQKSKLIGDATIYTKKGYAGNKTYQVDKYKGILEGSPTKKGLILPDKTVEMSKITMGRTIESQPVSIYLEEPFDEKKDKISRVNKPELNVSDRPFNNYQNAEILTKGPVYKPLKKSNFD